MPKWTHGFFILVWLATALVFARLAIDSYQASKTQLERFNVDFPTWGTVQIMGIDLPKLLKDQSVANNKNVDALEQSIRDTAKLTLGLNILSAFMALMGLSAQIGVYRYEQRKKHAEESAAKRDPKPESVGENPNLRQSASE